MVVYENAMRKSTPITIFLLILSEIAGIAMPAISWADEGVYLDQKTIERGYPATSDDGIITMAIPPNALKKPTTISITPAPDAIVPKEITPLTQAYDISLMRDTQPVILASSIPLIVSIPKISQQSGIFLWNEPTQEWLKLTTFKRSSTALKTHIDFSVLRVAVFSAKTTSLPARIALPKINTETIVSSTGAEISHTVSATSLDSEIFFSFDRRFSVTIAPDALLEPATLTITNKENIYGPPAYRVFSSPIYEFDIKTQSGSHIILSRPLMLTFYGIKKTATQKRINFLNQTTPAWEPLPTTRDISTNSLTAPINLPYAKIALFESTVLHEGQASWFSDALTKKARYGAASNDYPMGTKLIVTNTENNKNVDVTVVSTGPFVEGRIIDLTKSAFSKLANPGVGIISITVSKKE